MKGDSWWIAFEAMPLPRHGDAFTCTSLSATRDTLLGKDAAGSPCILIRAAASAAPRYAVALRHLTVTPWLRCRVDIDGSTSEGGYALIRCITDSRELMAYFVAVVTGAISAGASAAETGPDASRLVSQLVELFMALEAPSTGSAAGLWGELFVALYSADPISALGAWHSDAVERYDFAAGAERVEVKSWMHGRRFHHFSYDQLNAPQGACVVIASLLAQPSAGGMTLGALWDAARVLTNPKAELLARVERVCAATLGSDWQAARDVAFDLQAAHQSLQFYDIRHVPGVRGALPAGVSGLTFVSDLELAVPLPQNSLLLSGWLASAIARRRRSLPPTA